MIVSQYPYGMICGALVLASFRLTVSGKVLEGCGYIVLCHPALVITLKPLHGRYRKHTVEIGIFAVCLFRPSPAGVTADVNDRSEGMVRAP